MVGLLLRGPKHMVARAQLTRVARLSPSCPARPAIRTPLPRSVAHAPSTLVRHWRAPQAGQVIPQHGLDKASQVCSGYSQARHHLVRRHPMGRVQPLLTCRLSTGISIAGARGADVGVTGPLGVYPGQGRPVHVEILAPAGRRGRQRAGGACLYPVDQVLVRGGSDRALEPSPIVGD
jgi:surface antigen